MKAYHKLQIIKWVHTLIWVVFAGMVFYILYSGIINNVNLFTRIAIGLILGEGFVLLVFRMYCPLTLLARRYSDSDRSNFDIFLPNWLARYNKLIFTTLFLAGVILVLVRVVLGC